jgi:putative membrane protein
MLRRALRLTPYVALCAAAIVSGCSSRDKKADSAKIADSVAAATPAAAPTPPPAPALTDANILAKLDADNVADSSAGALASTKGTDAAVKEYGRMMVKDHHAMRADGIALAKKDSITPAMPAGDTDEAAEKAVADSLTSMPKGAAWDRFYIDHMVTGHEKVLRFLQDASNAAQNADLKAMIQKGTPIVQKHLDRAKAIQTKLGAPKP